MHNQLVKLLGLYQWNGPASVLWTKVTHGQVVHFQHNWPRRYVLFPRSRLQPVDVNATDCDIHYRVLVWAWSDRLDLLGRDVQLQSNVSKHRGLLDLDLDREHSYSVPFQSNCWLHLAHLRFDIYDWLSIHFTMHERDEGPTKR